MAKTTQATPTYVSVEREDLRALLKLARVTWRDHVTEDVAALDKRISDILDVGDEADRRAEVWRKAKCPVCGVRVVSHDLKVGWSYRDEYGGPMGGPGHIIAAGDPPKRQPVSGRWDVERAEFADEHTFHPCGHTWRGKWTPDMKIEPTVKPCELGHSWRFPGHHGRIVCDVCGEQG